MEKKRKKKKSKGKAKWIVAITLGIICLAGGIVAADRNLKKKEMQEKPENLLNVYMNHISEKIWGNVSSD